MKQEELYKNCEALLFKLEGDIDGIDLYKEFMICHNILPQNSSKLTASNYIS